MEINELVEYFVFKKMLLRIEMQLETLHIRP